MSRTRTIRAKEMELSDRRGEKEKKISHSAYSCTFEY